jgi:ribokinase
MKNVRIPRIAVVGSYNRDLGFVFARLPRAGETVLGAAHDEGPGGKGSNQAIQAALAGADVTFVAAIGRDAAGDAALALWKAAGVGAAHVVRKPGTATGAAAILVETGGDNRIVVASGANARLSAADIGKAAAAIGRAAVVVGQLEVPVAATAAAFARARKQGVATLLNAAPAEGRLPKALEGKVDLLVANEGEAQALTGLPADTPHETLAFALGRLAARAAVLTAGAAGAWLACKDAAPVDYAAPKVRVVDTTGAGDAFVGTFAARFALDGDLDAAMRWGVAAGSLACRRRGAASSYAGHAAVARLAGRKR